MDKPKNAYGVHVLLACFTEAQCYNHDVKDVYYSVIIDICEGIPVWFRCSLSKQTVSGNKVCMIQNREPTQTVCQIRYKIRKSVRLGRSYLASSGKRFFPFSVILIAPICLNISMLSVMFQYSASLPLIMR